MSATLGRLIARLAEPAETTPDADLVERINTAVNPPDRVSIDDVYVRAMFIVSDEVNSFGGCFPVDEHARLCRLLVDSPVMVGHRKDRLPIGRNFHAETVERDGRRWVKCWFYWLKKADGAETLRENIDGGVYKECSISFTFLLPECSICGKDIRLCRHQPFDKYDDDGAERICYFRYRRIERVLETSLVYRGAVPNTAITRQLSADDIATAHTDDVVLDDPDKLPDADNYLVVPAYDGIAVTLSADGTLTTPSGTEISLPGLGGIVADEAAEPIGYLIGLRGKERCSTAALRRHLSGEDSPITRLELRLIGSGNEFRPETRDRHRLTIRPLRYRRCAKLEIADTLRTLGTRDGVRVWPSDRAPITSAPYRLTSENTPTVKPDEYRLHIREGSPTASLMIPYDCAVLRFDIRQFHLGRFRQGVRFVADRIEHRGALPPARTTISGRVTELAEDDGAFVMDFSGMLSGTVVVRPIKIDGRERYLVYRLMNQR